MIVAPAAGIGLLLIGLGGAFVPLLIMELVESWRNGNLFKSQDSYRPVYKKELLSDGWQTALGIAGGIIAVAAVIGLMLIVSPMWSDVIWTGLTILGYVGGFLSFVIFGSRSISKTSSKRKATGGRARRGIKKTHRKKQAVPQAEVIDAQFTGPEPVKARQAPQAKSQTRAKRNQREGENVGAIRRDFYSVFSIPDDQSKKRNYLLADVLNRYFIVSDILIRDPFEVVAQDGEGLTEIVRGVIEIDGYQYPALMEWCEEPLCRHKVSRQLFQIFNCGHPRGIVMTNTRFSQSAIDSCKEVLAHKVVLLCELEEIVTLMERDGRLKDFMKAKIRNAVENKVPL